MKDLRELWGSWKEVKHKLEDYDLDVQEDEARSGLAAAVV